MLVRSLLICKKRARAKGSLQGAHDKTMNGSTIHLVVLREVLAFFYDHTIVFAEHDSQRGSSGSQCAPKPPGGQYIVKKLFDWNRKRCAQVRKHVSVCLRACAYVKWLLKSFQRFEIRGRSTEYDESCGVSLETTGTV